MIRMIPILRDFNHFIDKKHFKNWQVITLEVNLDLYGRHMPEERIPGTNIDLDLFAVLTNMRVFMVL